MINKSRSHHSNIYYSDDICNLACWGLAFLDTDYFIIRYAGVITAKGLMTSKRKRLKREQRWYLMILKSSPLGNSWCVHSDRHLLSFLLLSIVPFQKTHTAFRYPNTHFVGYLIVGTIKGTPTQRSFAWDMQKLPRVSFVHKANTLTKG